MKICTLFGTRPEIIRLSAVIKVLDGHCDQQLVHTGQNHDPRLSDVFFTDLGLRQPDIHLGVEAASFAEQVGQILARAGEVFARERPDRVLILGDTNSALAALVAARMGIPVFHMEAGNRCYDDRVPEEVNRRIIDHASTILMPYTERSKENLVREGIERDRIFVTGNPIFEVLEAHTAGIEASDVIDRMQLVSGEYLLVTLHRAENVDEPRRLESFLAAFSAVAEDQACPVVVSVHPRTADKLHRFGLGPASPHVRMLDPLGFLDFVKLERYARAVLSDSGTVQEECAIFGVPNVTLRDVTERPETLECGSNVLSGAAAGDVLRALRLALSLGHDWKAPREYLQPRASRAVAKILLGYLSVRRHHAPQ
ncbi:MAG: UDP-N-acetylglucosamine 2-epimerase (non-hydrolyzing) [Acidobacteria bacterium]|nr:UDP-N-acetylglucosamine 2-epimerase (non-hydrolyzing) [Acidobacteriota bacterium]